MAKPEHTEVPGTETDASARERYLDYRRQYYRNNRDKWRTYYNNNRERILAQNRKAAKNRRAAEGKQKIPADTSVPKPAKKQAVTDLTTNYDRDIILEAIRREREGQT